MDSFPVIENHKRPIEEQKNDTDRTHFASLHANLQTGKPASMQLSHDKKLSPTLSVEKYSTYLPGSLKKALRKIAFETDRKDYEVLIEAVELYLKNKK